MLSTTPPHPQSVRHRRIGRRVLLAHRLNPASKPAKQNRIAALKSRIKARPKTSALLAVGFLALCVLATGGAHLYSTTTAAAEKAATEKRYAAEKRDSLAADACRRKKFEEKADLLGKITFDELYDNNECDK